MAEMAADAVVIRPEISTAALESTHVHAPSAMSEVTDNAAMHLDPFGLTETVHEAAKEGARGLNAMLGRDGGVSNREPGVLKAVWNGFLDDLFGAPKLRVASA